MEGGWQEQHDVLRNDVDQMTGKLDRVLEILANLNRPPPPVVVENAAVIGPIPPRDPSSSNVPWPPYGLPIGYTPPGYMPPLTEGPTIAQAIQVHVGNNTEVPANQPGAPQAQLGRATPQENIEDPRNAYQDLANMCLVPDLVLPQKFKVPDFEKYKGLSCPKSHLYMQLEGSRIRSWRDLVNAFVRQYQYNVDMAPSRTQLQNMSQKDDESFKVYAQRWRELAAQVRPPLLETELVDMFTNTLKGVYFERMVGSVSSGFSDLVKIRERIENGIKSGKIFVASGNQNAMKKSSDNFSERK
ncbi:hypothetical protein A2U01_0007582 [Trifolium medium]|uniref:Retrotransposon gag domain-containing protein n=1 Tax=Trifolium medium TaxID=97028 RepID=A0A392MGV9_9FABA|nr:hypothetical protein [Trifolium medium]